MGILRSLFPSWLPRLFRVMFAKPFPAFSSTMNALATALACKWLMGPLKINDVEVDGGKVIAPAKPCSKCREARGKSLHLSLPPLCQGPGVLRRFIATPFAARRLVSRTACWSSGAATWRRPAAPPSASTRARCPPRSSF